MLKADFSVLLKGGCLLKITLIFVMSYLAINFIYVIFFSKKISHNILNKIVPNYLMAIYNFKDKYSLNNVRT